MRLASLCFIYLWLTVMAGAAPQEEYARLVALFPEWRVFEASGSRDGAPDYMSPAMSAKAAGLPGSWCLPVTASIRRRNTTRARGRLTRARSQNETFAFALFAAFSVALSVTIVPTMFPPAMT